MTFCSAGFQHVPTTMDLTKQEWIWVPKSGMNIALDRSRGLSSQNTSANWFLNVMMSCTNINMYLASFQNRTKSNDILYNMIHIIMTIHIAWHSIYIMIHIIYLYLYISIYTHISHIGVYHAIAPTPSFPSLGRLAILWDMDAKGGPEEKMEEIFAGACMP